MLGDNIKKYRMEKEYTQEMLAQKLNVVRQTISKWEKGVSVPDAEMLNRISEELDTPVNILLGKYVEEIQQDTETEIDEVAKQLALVNSQLSNQIAKSRDYVRKVITAILIIILLAAAIWATHFCKTHGYISNNMQSSGEVIYVSDAELNIIK